MKWLVVAYLLGLPVQQYAFLTQGACVKVARFLNVERPAFQYKCERIK